ncbi:threonine/serine dehydratase [Hyphobacterium sp. SN044]|uniref:threonine ammonia-lyase n=1 Tax=Hyphobacterium sp. SN044 TaxID=2912575 RepID=UPI002351B5C1|nr:threonine/serine dehydratase [Hyphobacterium sp. SN044]
MNVQQLPEYSDILDAARRIAAEAVHTPLLENEVLNARTGGRVLIKPECLQRTGSFKFRGAFNRLSLIPEPDRPKGVVAFSSGNHAQGVACAAKLLGIPAIIVMPSDAPKVKADGVRRYGAEIVAYDRERDDREAIAATYVEERGMTLVPSYDDPFIVAGQGTCGLEIARSLENLNLTPDALVCCTGGGGLIAGIGLAMLHHFPQVEIWAAEPEGFDDHARSLAAGERVSNTRLGGSVQDALLTPSPGKITFALNQRQLTGAVQTSDDEALDAVAFAHANLKLVAEPGGATALGAILSGKIDVTDRTVICVLTGGNVDPEIYRRALDRL